MVKKPIKSEVRILYVRRGIIIKQIIYTLIIFFIISFSIIQKSFCDLDGLQIEKTIDESDLIAVVLIHEALSEKEIFGKYDLRSEFQYFAVAEVIETLKGKKSPKYIAINYQYRAQKPNILCLEKGKKYLLCLKGTGTTYTLINPYNAYWDDDKSSGSYYKEEIMKRLKK